jgi:multidrug efflux pump subunit AcrA (membrane-fusion protein)
MTRRTLRRVALLPALVPAAVVTVLATVGGVGAATPQPAAAEFNIFGLVDSPGTYAWSEGMTVKQAVDLAGGYAARGSKDELQIQRLIEGKLTSLMVKEDDPVQADDVIMVRARRYAGPAGRSAVRPVGPTTGAYAFGRCSPHTV